MSVSRRREMIDPSHAALSIARQCKLVSISRSAFYAGPMPRSGSAWTARADGWTTSSLSASGAA